MNIQPITPPLRPGQELQCVACGRMGATVADLDGPAFQAYYHPACVPGNDYDKPLQWDHAPALDAFDAAHPPKDPPLHCGQCGVVFPADRAHVCAGER
jgi:hypothetical protein